MDENKGIYKKILRVMEDVEYLAKDDTISYKDVNYRGLSEEKVTRTVRERLVKYGIIVYPIHQEHRKEGTLSTVDVTYRFVDTEDGSFIEAVSSGTGTDSQDKGVGKAMTYAYKYLWLRTFAIPTGEDPDKVSSAELDDKQVEDRCRKGKKEILQLCEDAAVVLTEDYLDSVKLDVDVAYEKKDAEMMVKIYRDIESELKKARLKESKSDEKEVFAKAADRFAKAKKYGEEPPLPDSEPDPPGMFVEIKQEEIF